MTTQHQTAPARRWAGLIVLVLVALVAVVLPGTMSRSIPGVAGRGPVPRMPTVGDCLLRPVGPPDSAADGELIYPPVSTGPCSGPRFGEVVAVVASPKVQPPIVSPIDGSVADPSATACDDDVAGFLGTAAAVAPAQRSAVTWVVLPASVRSLRVEPSDLQKSVGQRWIACVGYLDPESVGQASADDYLRSAKGTFHLGSPPAAFATCVTSLVAGAMNHGDCFQPHASRVVRFGVRPNRCVGSPVENHLPSAGEQIHGPDRPDGGRPIGRAGRGQPKQQDGGGWRCRHLHQRGDLPGPADGGTAAVRAADGIGRQASPAQVRRRALAAGQRQRRMNSRSRMSRPAAIPRRSNRVRGRKAGRAAQPG